MKQAHERARACGNARARALHKQSDDGRLLHEAKGRFIFLPPRGATPRDGFAGNAQETGEQKKRQATAAADAAPLAIRQRLPPLPVACRHALLTARAGWMPVPILPATAFPFHRLR